MVKFSRKPTAPMPHLAISPPASGPNVLSWQYFLKTKGFYKPHQLTGEFDYETLFATQTFQRQNNLPAHGVVYQQTWDLAFLQGFATFDELVHDHHFRALTVADIHTASGAKRYTLKPGEMIRMPPLLEPILAKIAKDFFFQTGEMLVVTSGTRTAEEQAQAMKHNLETQGRQYMIGLYTKDPSALNEILAAYDAAAKIDQARLEAMTHAINSQIGRRIFISKHLTGGGIDLRWPPHPNRQRLENMLKARAKEVGDIEPPLNEADHLHIQLKGNR